MGLAWKPTSRKKADADDFYCVFVLGFVVFHSSYSTNHHD